MSRGFVKEADYTEPVAQRSVPVAITARGMTALEARLAAASDPAQRALLAQRIATSFVPEAPADAQTVAFGASVRVRGAGRRALAFAIVGEDEVDVSRGAIGEDSPLGRALLGARVGDTVTWHRPAGDRQLEILAIDY